MTIAENISWISLCALSDIPKRGARVVKSAAGCIAIFRTQMDEVYALDDRCPHKGGPLSQGIVHGAAVTCPLHNWVISLESGMVNGENGHVRTYPLKVADGQVLLMMGATA